MQLLAAYPARNGPRDGNVHPAVGVLHHLVALKRAALRTALLAGGLAGQKIFKRPFKEDVKGDREDY